VIGARAGRASAGAGVLAVGVGRVATLEEEADGVVQHIVVEKHRARLLVSVPEASGCVAGGHFRAIRQQAAGNHAVIIEVVVVARGDVHGRTGAHQLVVVAVDKGRGTGGRLGVAVEGDT